MEMLNTFLLGVMALSGVATGWLIHIRIPVKNKGGRPRKKTATAKPVPWPTGAPVKRHRAATAQELKRD